NLPPNLDPNQSFPGTIDPGSKSNNPGNNPQIGTNNASPGNAGLPSIFPPCGATTCQVIIVGLEQQPDKNTGLTFDPQQPPPNQQVAPPPNTNDNNTTQINLTIGGPTGPTSFGGGNGNGGDSGNNGGSNGAAKPNYGPSPGPGLGRTADEQRYSGVP